MCPRAIFFFFQAEGGIRDATVTGVQTCALPISWRGGSGSRIAESGASAPSRKSLGIRAPLQGAGPRKGFVARPGRPEARRARAGASAEAYGQHHHPVSDD